MTEINFAVELEIRGVRYRFATDRLVLQREIGCEQKTVAYQPRIISIDPGESNIEFDDSPKIPSVDIEIEDGDRTIIDAFENDVHESAEVTVFELDSDNNVIATSIGYMTDVEWEESVLSFTVRQDESRIQSTFGKPYTFDSFQYFDVLMPKDVEVAPEFIPNDSTPWQVYATELRRLKIGQQFITELGTGTILVNGLGGHVHPGVNAIRLEPHPDANTPHTNKPQFKYYRYASYDIDSTTDGGDPGAENFLEYVTSPDYLFEDDGGASYKKAVIGNSEGKAEVIKYGFCRLNEVWDPTLSTPGFRTIGGGPAYYLSAIPSASYQHPLDSKFSLSAAERQALVDDYSISKIHYKNEVASPIDQHDYIWVNANGLEPRGFNDPEVSVGFLYAGREYRNRITGKEYKALTRYKIVDPHENTPDAAIGTYAVFNMIDPDLVDGTEIDTVMKLELHNRAAIDPDTGNRVHALSSFGPGSRYELPTDTDEQSPLTIFKFMFVVEHIDVHLLNLDPDVKGNLLNDVLSEKEPLKDRFRGLRVDTFKDYASFIQKLYENYNSDGSVEEAEKINLNLINNATDKFAICIGSELKTEQFSNPSGTFNVLFERLYFAIDENKIGFQGESRLIVDGDSTNGPTNVELAREPENYFLNNLKVHHNASNTADFQNSLDTYGASAEQYFLNQRYRVIHDPVPENAQDLGRLFPIVYGVVDKVPMIQAISKKTFGSDTSTAGDDFYVYASHITDVKSPQDIQVWLFGDAEDVEGNRKIVDGDDFDNSIRSHIIESPFPNLSETHHIFDGDTIKYDGALYNPYHKLESRRTLDGDLVYGIRLRGAEWDERADKFDARYPVRNGVGSSTLYASFAGWVDRYGQLIEHPCDVLTHFVKTYGVQPYSENFLNLAELKKIKARTKRYKASVFIDGSEIGNDTVQLEAVENFIQDISIQFGLPYYLDSSSANYTLPDESYSDLSRPISEGYNLMEGVAQESTGYAEVYTKINYKYSYNYVNDRFDKEINLNADNNENCSRAARARGQKKAFTVEARYVRDSATARDVALRYAKLLTKRQSIIQCRVRYVDDIIFRPGEVVPMTYERFNMEQVPVVILEVKRERNFMELEVLRLEH